MINIVKWLPTFVKNDYPKNIINSRQAISLLSKVYREEDFNESENAYLVRLDSKSNLIDVLCISEKKFKYKILISKERLKNVINDKEVSSVYISHSHTSGLCLPSKADFILTEYVDNLCSLLGKNLNDHLILTPNYCYSFRADPNNKYN